MLSGMTLVLLISNVVPYFRSKPSRLLIIVNLDLENKLILRIN